MCKVIFCGLLSLLTKGALEGNCLCSVRPLVQVQNWNVQIVYQCNVTIDVLWEVYFTGLPLVNRLTNQ